MTARSSTSARPDGGGRVVGVDVARCLALLGMVVTHVLAAYDPETFRVDPLFQVAAGRASALFAVLAGTSLALTSGRTTPLRGRPLGAAAAGVAVRAVLVAAVGLALGHLDVGIAIILTYYGVLFVLAIPFLGLGARALFALAVPWLVLAPVLSQLLRPSLPERGFGSPDLASLGDLGLLASELAFTGYYPAVPWLGYLLLGMAIGRCDLRSWTAPTLLVSLGGAAALLAVAGSDLLLGTREGGRFLLDAFGTAEGARVALATGFSTAPADSWWWLAVRAPHSGTPFDLVQTAGSACVVLGVCLVVGRLLPDVSRVVFGAGAMTLTLYTAHVVLRATVWDDDTVQVLLQHVLAALLVGALFAVLRRRGPLEVAVGWVSDGVRHRVGAWRPSR